MVCKLKNNGKVYEDLVTYVYQQLSNLSGKRIEVKQNIKIKGKSGVYHQIDVFYEFELNNIKHMVIIECKDYRGKVEKGKVQSFKSVIEDLGNCIGIMVSRNGFQSGAIEYARHYDIELLSGGELPLLSKVMVKKLEVLLPNENSVGEPFWTIMEERNGELTGNYSCVKGKTIGLFISKKIALEVAEKIGGTVRGVSQKHLLFLAGLSEHEFVEICMFLLESDKGILIDYKVLQDYFLL